MLIVFMAVYFLQHLNDSIIKKNKYVLECNKIKIILKYQNILLA